MSVAQQLKDCSEVDFLVGARVRVLRESRRMSQTALGGAVGVSFQQIQKYERGVNRIAASTLFQIAMVLGVSPCDFFEGLESAGCTAGAWSGLADPQVRALLDGFARIPSARAKARIVDLVQAMAPQD